MTRKLILAAVAAPLWAYAALPYRYLVVVNDQWKDPASMVIEGGGEFNITAALLKTWGIPFDILRLDQQRIDKHHTLERDGSPRYGTIIWLAVQKSTGDRGSLISWLVKDAGVNLVVLGEHVASPEMRSLTGLDYVSENRLPDPLTIHQDHFLTRELKGRELEPAAGGSAYGYKTVAREATVLASRGNSPLLAIREYPNGANVVWIGAHHRPAQLARRFYRDLLKRALVWTQGYALYAEYPRSMLVEMHDQGSAEKTIHTFWHFQTLTEEHQRTHIIEPLKRHNARVTQVVVTGLVDRETQRILEPWKQSRYPDGLDGKTVHDYSSTKRGLDLGVREGVYEINSHGWTHHLPDLESEPGPYWTAPADGVATLGWFTEFTDSLRGKDVPAATQRFHMRRSIEYLERDFGVTPIFFRPPSGAPSLSYANHTPRIAAEMGFGLTRISSPYYLGRDLVVQLGPIVEGTTWATPEKRTSADVPWSIDGPYFMAYHDRDVALDPPWLNKVLDGLGEGVRYMTANEYVGYLHAQVDRAESAAEPWALRVRYDDHYCRWFHTHASEWTLHLSDGFRKKYNIAAAEKRRVRIEAGRGDHIVK